MRVVILALSQSAHCEARTDGFEVPKFSFDIFLKYNPNKSPNPEPLIRNNQKIFIERKSNKHP